MDIEQLLEAAWPDAFRIAHGITRDRALAEDAAQEACIAAYRSYGQLRDRDAFRPWFYRMVVRSATALAKKSAREHRREIESPRVEPPNVDRVAVGSALDVLPPTQRAVVVLSYYADLKSREIAAILGITDGAVRFRLYLAKRHLRCLLSTAETSPIKDEVISHVR